VTTIGKLSSLRFKSHTKTISVGGSRSDAREEHGMYEPRCNTIDLRQFGDIESRYHEGITESVPAVSDKPYTNSREEIRESKFS
jgi:hypothetical protein